MEIEPITSTIDAARWHIVFLLLSMDRVKPFWPDMGLSIPWSDTLQRIAQSFVRRYRQIEEDPALTTTQRIEQFNALYQSTFRDITSHDKEIADAIYHWGKAVFQYDLSADADTFLWGFLFRRLAGLSSQSYALVPLQLSGEQQEAVKRAIMNHMKPPSTLQQRFKAAEQAELSPWDDYVLKTYTSDASPMDWVLNTINFVNTTAVWRDIERILDKDDLAVLRRWGSQQAKGMGMTSSAENDPIKAN